MVLKKHLKHLLVFFLVMVVFASSSYLVEAKETKSTTYTYYKNKSIHTKKIVIKNNGKLKSSSTLSYSTKGQALEEVTTVYGAKNKRLVVSYFKFKNNKKYAVKKYYYYNTHTGNKTPLSRAYRVTSYKSNGKVDKTYYYTKDGKQREVVRIAKKQAGKRYRYGSASPQNGFDCSGLTSYVYKTSINSNIGRTSYAQTKKGKYVNVSTKTLQQGDILFWGSKSSPYHVGIYVGNGKYIHAQTPSTGVVYKKLSSYTPQYAKRIIY